MAKIFTEVLPAGSKVVIPLGSVSEGDINLNFQVSFRPLYVGEQDYRGERDISISPVVKIRPVHGDLNNTQYADVTQNSLTNKTKKAIGMRNANTKPDIVPSNIDSIHEDEFQIPELVSIDMAAGINTIIIKNIYCSAVLIDDSANELNDGDLVFTVVG